MPNHSSIDSNGIIRSTLEGDQDEITVSRLVESTTSLVRSLQTDNSDHEFKFLVDMRAIGGQTLGARQIGVKALKSTPYQKIAIFGANRFIKHITTLVILASGRGSKIKQFSNEESALRWLKTDE